MSAPDLNLREHTIVRSRVKSKCGAAGHTDLVVTCSCGWEHTFGHGRTGDDANMIMAHRLQVIERALKIEFHFGAVA